MSGFFYAFLLTITFFPLPSHSKSTLITSMKFLSVVILILVSFQAKAGGPWVLGKKKGYFQLQTTLPIGMYNRLFHRQGKSKDIYLHRGVIDTHYQAYLEYGLSDKLTLITTLPFKYVSTADDLNDASKVDFSEPLESGSLFAMANATIGLKYELFNKKWVGAVSTKLEMNTSTVDESTGLATGYDANALSAFFHLGRGFNASTYGFIEIGGTTRGNDFSDEYQVIVEYGQKLGEIWSAVVLDYKRSLRNGNRLTPNLDQTGLYPNNQEYFAWGFKFAKDLNEKTGINVSSFGAFSGHNVAHLASVNIGLYKKW